MAWSLPFSCTAMAPQIALYFFIYFVIFLKVVGNNKSSASRKNTQSIPSCNKFCIAMFLAAERPSLAFVSSIE